MDILNSFLDILNSEYLWISINRIMDIHKSFLNAVLVFIPYLWIIHKSFLDIQKSCRIKDIHNSF